MINKLCEALLYALESKGYDVVTKTVYAIQNVLDCDMCTLWSINHNNTDKELGKFVSASLLERCLKKGVVYSTHFDSDYVHPLQNSFIEQVLKDVEVDETIYRQYDLIKDEEKCKKHKSYKTLKEMGLKYFICIPIKNIDNNEFIAFIKLAYKEKPSFNKEEDSLKEEIITLINKAVISALSQHLVFQKQQILDNLIENYRQTNFTNLKDLFNPIIHYIFKKYFYYEGSSVFIWDYFDNRYNLLVSTGLKEITDKEEVFYEKGEGLTGLAAEENKGKIYDDLIALEKRKDSKYLHKYREYTKHDGTTLLAVPIVRSTDSKEVFGIIRFTNKINLQSLKEEHPVIDYFNETDVELIKNASHYLALNIENYLAEEERRGFISKMSHEYKTPATSTRVSAYRIKKKFLQNDERFMRFYFENYLQDIIDCSELQLMQVTTNLFLTKSNRNKPTKLKIKNYSIYKIINDSIRIVRPIAREKKVLFDNIKIDENFPKIMLKVDKNAFKILFYNLLTNAIKYARSPKSFRVFFHAKETPNALIINISDEGIGIDSKDVDRIFLLGTRSNKARRMNADGYGIGLHVVKLILEMFDSEIRVSHFFNPTTFEIKIPRKLYSENH